MTVTYKKKQQVRILAILWVARVETACCKDTVNEQQSEDIVLKGEGEPQVTLRFQDCVTIIIVPLTTQIQRQRFMLEGAGTASGKGHMKGKVRSPSHRPSPTTQNIMCSPILFSCSIQGKRISILKLSLIILCPQWFICIHPEQVWRDFPWEYSCTSAKADLAEASGAPASFSLDSCCLTLKNHHLRPSAPHQPSPLTSVSLQTHYSPHLQHAGKKFKT